MCIHKGEDGDLVYREFAARVEPEPAEPQQGGAECHERDVVWSLLRRAPASQKQHRAECGHAGGGMHDDAPRKVEYPPIRQKPTAPDHVGKGVIHQELPEGEKNEIRAEPYPVGERAP